MNPFRVINVYPSIENSDFKRDIPNNEEKQILSNKENLYWKIITET